MLIKVNNWKLTLRKCKHSDYRFVYNTTKRYIKRYADKYWGGWNPKKFREDFNINEIKIILYKSKRIGLYQLIFNDYFAYIRNIYISTIFKNKGLGTYFINLMEKEARSKGYTKIRLQVFKENPAIKLYYRLNYRIIRDTGYSLILEKRL